MVLTLMTMTKSEIYAIGVSNICIMLKVLTRSISDHLR